jgi:hypothetical protein
MKVASIFDPLDEYFEYLFGGSKIFGGINVHVMKRMKKQKFPLDVNHGVIWAYNKMHVGFRVRMEWGIGGLKQNVS